MARVASVFTASSATSTRSSKRKQGDPVTAPSKRTHQRKTPAKTARKVKNATETASSSSITSPAAKKKSQDRKESTEPPTERRLRRFRHFPPVSYQQRLERAVTQRMFVVGQTVARMDEVLELNFDIVGSTGNIYKTIIRKVPTCNCPDARKGNQCKHICYVLVKVLKAPSHLQYQLAFLSSELREIYENSPLRTLKDKAEEHDTDGKRKAVEGDCPICFMEFKPDKEDIVWCRAACGNNIHKACFQKWAASSNHQGVRCVYCRSPWQNQDTDGRVDVTLEQLVAQGRVGEDGYINVASQMGLSGERDFSTYYQRWVHRRSYYSGWRDYGEDYEEYY
ncbi:hypothetical protein BDW75DRAFT_34563 [Aspergillus navahoensis]